MEVSLKNERVFIGANNPPSDAQLAEEADAALRAYLERESAQLLESARTAYAEAAAAPKAVNDDTEAGSLGDLALKIGKISKALDGMRVKEKEPHLRAGRVVDAFFKKPMESLDKAKGILSDTCTAYQRRKAEEERRRREEEARRQREEEDRKRQEALRLAREAEELERLKQKDLAEQTLAEAAKLEREAAQTAITAEKAEKKAEAKAADISRTRGVLGSTQSLRTVWAAEPVGSQEECRAALDWQKIGPYIPFEAIQVAANLYMKAGGRELSGFKIHEKQDVVFR